MAAPPPISWTELFQAKGKADYRLQFRVLKKAGHPFLLLPDSSSLAARALSLYPAQSPKARLAKKVLSTALKVGIPLRLDKITINFSLNDPFALFLKQLVGNKSERFPSFAVLAGNPNVEGRRFIVLLFDDYGQPAVVVKAGIGESARQLIRKESAFLRSVPSGIAGLPLFRGPFDSEAVEALALQYVEGDSPTGENGARIGKVLTSWINLEQRVRIEDVPAWQSLKKVSSSNPLFSRLSNKLAGVTFHPTLFHGDFAPWNIKVSRTDGAWTVLDWERGEHIGFPGWDWFHYILQTGILVEKWSPGELALRIDELLQTDSFQTYAESAGIEGNEKVLVTAYLLYCVNVLRPSEGLHSCEELLSFLLNRECYQ